MDYALYERMFNVVNARLFTNPADKSLRGNDLANEISFHISNMINTITGNSLLTQNNRMDCIKIVMDRLTTQYELSKRILSLFDGETITIADVNNEVYGDIVVNIIMDRLETTKQHEKISSAYLPLKVFLSTNKLTVDAEVSPRETSYQIFLANPEYEALICKLIAEIIMSKSVAESIKFTW